MSWGYILHPLESFPKQPSRSFRSFQCRSLFGKNCARPSALKFYPCGGSSATGQLKQRWLKCRFLLHSCSIYSFGVKIFTTEDTHIAVVHLQENVPGVSNVTENPAYISSSDMFLLGGIFSATLWSCASNKNAMVLRCLVVDCGGVTHPDSGLKEATCRVSDRLRCGPWSSRVVVLWWTTETFVLNGGKIMVGFNHSMNYQLEESDFETLTILPFSWVDYVGFLGRMAQISGRLLPNKKILRFRTNPHSKNHKSIKFAWIVVTMLGSEIPCEGDEGEEIFRCKGCKYELIQQLSTTLDSEKIPWTSL